MRKMLSDQEKEDQHKRQMKMEAGKRYQQELDAQLKELRDRSFASLASKFIVSWVYDISYLVYYENTMLFSNFVFCNSKASICILFCILPDYAFFHVMLCLYKNVSST